ncbi:hypothetical protein FISHEDRAFT_39466 [Fistulina hepatica ATCC 64428]|uniref:Glycosyl transferase CAP10 domain-containing protein n=1 Tax=Fistulina hepatica ATCC 64428 TaxID=1128425 RepID=A0A0D7AFH6_9AGAR|nr:hypothetical protein FISHEDRAFT_39466 [Fistulina hepatica ATCC 64428]
MRLGKTSLARAGKWVAVVFFVYTLVLCVRFTDHQPKTLHVDVVSVKNVLQSASSANHLKQRRPLLGHVYHSDGLLHVNHSAAHPIYELIHKAERSWDAKLKRASTTLEEAVAEYRRRYGRAPPKGFDIWWHFVQEKEVLLPDEYDQIMLDLEPFFGYEPHELRSIRDNLPNVLPPAAVYTVGKTREGTLSILDATTLEPNPQGSAYGSIQVVTMLKAIEHLLPEFHIHVFAQDRPTAHTDYVVKEALLAAVRSGTYLKVADLPKTRSMGWLSACAPQSKVRAMKVDIGKEPSPPENKTFIYDHTASMSPCAHPQLFWNHGQFTSHGYGPTPLKDLKPIFSYSATTVHHDIRVPFSYGWIEDLKPSSNPEWDERNDNRLVWRGSNTGMHYFPGWGWNRSARTVAVGLVNDATGTVEFLDPTKAPHEPVGPALEYNATDVNPALFDVGFTGGVLGCGDMAVCGNLSEKYAWKDKQSIEEAGNYKYVIDVSLCQGNGWSGRFKRLMTSNALVFKSTIYPEWFMDRVEPWVHYVPIQVDMSDLHDTLVFFRGDESGVGAHDALASKIAISGREWSKRFWRLEDMQAYFLRLILEYARLMSDDRESMSYMGP